MSRLLGAALALLWGAGVFLRSVLAGPGAAAAAAGGWGNTPRAASPDPTPRGLEYRTIKRLPAGRVLALRLQVVLA